jgi:hypothetical protein
MENIRLWVLNSIAVLMCTSYSYSQTNEDLNIEVPSNSLRIVLYAKNRPVVSGYVILKNGEMLNHGVFTIFDVEGNIIQKITYDKGKVVRIESFDPELKS